MSLTSSIASNLSDAPHDPRRRTREAINFDDLDGASDISLSDDSMTDAPLPHSSPPRPCGGHSSTMTPCGSSLSIVGSGLATPQTALPFLIRSRRSSDMAVSRKSLSNEQQAEALQLYVDRGGVWTDEVHELLGTLKYASPQLLPKNWEALFLDRKVAGGGSGGELSHRPRKLLGPEDWIRLVCAATTATTTASGLSDSVDRHEGPANEGGADFSDSVGSSSSLQISAFSASTSSPHVVRAVPRTVPPIALTPPSSPARGGSAVQERTTEAPTPVTTAAPMGSSGPLSSSVAEKRHLHHGHRHKTKPSLHECSSSPQSSSQPSTEVSLSWPASHEKKPVGDGPIVPVSESRVFLSPPSTPPSLSPHHSGLARDGASLLDDSPLQKAEAMLRLFLLCLNTPSTEKSTDYLSQSGWVAFVEEVRRTSVDARLPPEPILHDAEFTIGRAVQASGAPGLSLTAFSNLLYHQLNEVSTELTTRVHLPEIGHHKPEAENLQRPLKASQRSSYRLNMPSADQGAMRWEGRTLPTCAMVLAAVLPAEVSAVCSLPVTRYLRSIGLMREVLSSLVQRLRQNADGPTASLSTGVTSAVMQPHPPRRPLSASPLPQTAMKGRIRPFTSSPGYSTPLVPSTNPSHLLEEPATTHAIFDGGYGASLSRTPRDSDRQRGSSYSSSDEDDEEQQASTRTQPRYLQPRPLDDITTSALARAKARRLMDQLRRHTVPINRYECYAKVDSQDIPIHKSLCFVTADDLQRTIGNGGAGSDADEDEDSDAMSDMERVLTIPANANAPEFSATSNGRPPRPNRSSRLSSTVNALSLTTRKPQSAGPPPPPPPKAWGMFRIGGILYDTVPRRDQKKMFQRLSQPQVDPKKLGLQADWNLKETFGSSSASYTTAPSSTSAASGAEPKSPLQPSGEVATQELPRHTKKIRVLMRRERRPSADRSSLSETSSRISELDQIESQKARMTAAAAATVAHYISQRPGSGSTAGSPMLLGPPAMPHFIRRRVSKEFQRPYEVKARGKHVLTMRQRRGSPAGADSRQPLPSAQQTGVKKARVGATKRPSVSPGKRSNTPSSADPSGFRPGVQLAKRPMPPSGTAPPLQRRGRKSSSASASTAVPFRRRS